MTRVGIYPGSFNPPTIAHLAIADAARRQCDLDRVELAHSSRVLGKGQIDRPLFEHRVGVLEAVAAELPWLSAVVTRQRLLADIAEGHDVVIMGADKWHQIHELQWYEDDPDQRDAVLSRLPRPAIAPRPPLSVPVEFRLRLPNDLPPGVSSTAAREGRIDLMAPAAARFAERTGAWIDPDRYERWLDASGWTANPSAT